VQISEEAHAGTGQHSTDHLVHRQRAATLRNGAPPVRLRLPNKNVSLTS
jgi:hypothetical protein